MDRFVPLVALSLLAVAQPALADETFLDEPIALPWECLPAQGCENPTCARVAGAWTQASQPRVDVYITKVVKQKVNLADVGAVDPASLVAEVVAAAEEHARDLVDGGPPLAPGAINGRGIVVQIELTVPGHDDPDMEGLRLTFEVDLLGCIGE